MFSTMPSLVERLERERRVGGILARKLVSGLPSGSSGCDGFPPSELPHRNLAQDPQALLAWL
jgi:hypothetical protein